MEMIVLKYVQLVCITIFMKNNANCAQLMSQTEEMSNLKVTACAADCLNVNFNYNITECYQQCANRSSETLNDVTAEEEPTDASFHLYCRDSNRLLIQVDKSDVGHVENEKFIYLLIIQETKISFVDRFVYISDEPIIELRDLKPSESYNISATVVSSNYDYHFLGTQIFTTLKPDFNPENVIDFEVIKFEPIEGNGTHCKALIHWEPARDQTCIYDLFLHGPGYNFKSDEKENMDLYFHEYEALRYNAEYSVAIRGINFNGKNDGNDTWHTFTTPSCSVLHEEAAHCEPEEIVNFSAKVNHVSDQQFTISANWNEPELKPDFYTLEVRDIDPIRNEDGSFRIYKYTLDQNKTSIDIEDLEFVGNQALIALEAHRNNLTTSYHLLVSVSHQKIQSMNFKILIYLFIIFVAFVCFIFLLCNNQISKLISDNKQKRFDSMDLDLIKTTTKLQIIADLSKDETMEIERENITLLDKLGEGAFGLVKKAALVQDGSKLQVAVKMLKDSAKIDDIKQFHQEISVMKSVGPHPNIVSIIGHCTSNIDELMLLTEYCDAGSLLDFLRSEFTKQLNFYDKNITLAPAINCHKHPENLQNFDNEEKETSSYKRFECSSRLFVVNPMYDELNNNNEIEMHQRQATLKAICMTATNPLYLELSAKDSKPVIVEISEPETSKKLLTGANLISFAKQVSDLELSDNDSKPVIVEIPEPETSKNFLTGAHLISFAKQVSDGMEFLAQKKVVHRDLAARNILVCSNGTAKIADFGLSRDIYTDNIYTKKGSGKLPIKWLAIESMTTQVYTSKSDVWSFGILLFEIVTLGMQPYPSIDVKDLLKILNTGYRMEKPNHCHLSLYHLMMSCWHANPDSRPTFQEVSDKLSHFLMLEDTQDERFIDLHKFYDKCSSERNYMKPIA